jgi:hypothetical protein
MARQINETLELERENELYSDTLYLLKTELGKIRREYTLESNTQLSLIDIGRLDDDLESLVQAIETTLLGL